MHQALDKALRRSLWLLVALLPLLIAARVSAAQAPFLHPYAAETAIRTGKGPELVSKVWVGGPDRWRVEVGGQPGMPAKIPMMATIVRLDRKQMYTLLPQARSYYATPLTADDATPGLKPQASAAAQVSRRPLGAEAVAGHPAHKWEVTAISPDGKKVVHYEWLSDALAMPLKMAAADGSWSMEYRSLKVGPQDPKLFEVPAGFQRLSLPGASGPHPGRLPVAPMKRPGKS